MAALILLTGIIASLPLRLFVEDSLDAYEFTDLNGASLFSGDIWLKYEELAGLIHISYHWCPGLSPLAWCADLQHASAAMDGRFAFSGVEEVEASSLRIDFIDLAALGVAGGLVNSRISGELNELSITMGNCPLRQIKSLEGSLDAANVQLFGASLGPHQMSFNNSDAGIRANLQGETFTGIIELDGSKYSARGELEAPESIAAMARSLMTPLGNNRFSWAISGALPC